MIVFPRSPSDVRSFPLQSSYQRAVAQRKSSCAAACLSSPTAARRSEGKDLFFMVQSNSMSMLAVLYGSAFVAAFNENIVNVALVSISGRALHRCRNGAVAGHWIYDRHRHRRHGNRLPLEAPAPPLAVFWRCGVSDRRITRLHDCARISRAACRPSRAGHRHGDADPGHDEHRAGRRATQAAGNLPVHRKLHDHLRPGFRPRRVGPHGDGIRMAQRLSSLRRHRGVAGGVRCAADSKHS